MSPNPPFLVAMQSLALVGVDTKTVRTFSPAGTTTWVAICIRNGEALFAAGDTLSQALTNLATAAGLVAMTERYRVRQAVVS